jgi:hypothetical protein
MNNVTRLGQRMRGRIKVSPTGKPHISVKVLAGDELLELLTRIFGILGGNING